MDKIIDEIREFNRYYTKIIGLLDSNILESEFSLTEARIIYEIAKGKNITANQIVEKLGIDKGLLSRIIKKFASKNIVERKNKESDKRSYLLMLTDKGKEVFIELEKKSNMQIENLIGGIKESDKKELRCAMDSIKNIIKKHDYIIREFKEDDLTFIIDLHEDIYKKEFEFNSTFREYVSETIEKFTKRYNKELDKIWILEENGKRAGIIAMINGEDNYAQLRWFLLSSESRGKGYGKKLMDKAMEFAREKDYNGVYLLTVKECTDARKIYEKYGFGLVESWSPANLWGVFVQEEKWQVDFK